MSTTSAQRSVLGWLRRLPRPLPPPRRSPLARALLRRGEAAAALWWGGGDPVVLSALGLHLSAQQLVGRYRDRRPDRSLALARLRTAVALGGSDEALALARPLLSGNAQLRATCERLLVALDDARVPPLLSPGSTGRAAAWLARGDPVRALDELDSLGGPDGDRPAADATDRLAVRIGACRRLGRADEAQDALRRLAGLQSLRPVDFDGSGIAGLRCESRPNTVPTLVSIVMPVHNVAAHLPAALGSVQRQDHRALQILVVDDASDDGTAGVAEAAAALDPRITVIRRGVRGGAYRARNDGLARAVGSFVTFHDGDDWSHPQKISLQLQALEQQPDKVACLSDWVRMRDDGMLFARQVCPLVRLNMSSLMLRRTTVWPRAGCFDPVLAGADSEYPARLRLLFGRDAVVRVRKLLSFASTRPQSLMHDASTGYASEHGRLQRLRYWEAWNRWHAEVFGSGDTAALRLDPDSRPFEVPEAVPDLVPRVGKSATPPGVAARGPTDR